MQQAPAFVGVKVLEFLDMHDNIRFRWQQAQHAAILSRERCSEQPGEEDEEGVRHFCLALPCLALPCHLPLHAPENANEVITFVTQLLLPLLTC